MKEVAISECKAKCLAVLEQFQKTGRPIRITRHEKPVADVISPALRMHRIAWIGSMKDSMEINGDIIAPANDEKEWEVLHE
jgi:antitoxin (DNA-binding transcriptional repressor) of toxin-antitoxin stability system